MADTFTFLKARFQHALLLGVGAPGLLVGCGPGEGIEDDDGFVEVTCSEPYQPDYLAHVVPGEPVDYLGLAAMVSTEASFAPREEIGDPCATATNVDACMRALLEPPVESSLLLGGGGQFFAYSVLRATRGDDVIEVTSGGALREFLVPIDSPGDAVLLATTAGFNATCSRSGARPSATGYEVQLFTFPGCDGRRRHLIHVNAAGEMEHLDGVTEHEPDAHCIVGRRPLGLVAQRRKGCSLGDHFARSAELEAASVPAFETLERELMAHGAPRAFARRCRRAAQDEVRHARDVARLARRLGGRPCKPEVVPLAAVRSLEAIALENALEGCVRETYGALVAQHQAARSRLPAVRRLYARIADDETRHAALAWDIARWAEAHAGAAARQRIRAAMRDAVHQLRESAGQPVTPELADVAGLPQPGTARVMLGALEQTLWSRMG
jgi:hypothetical protein